MRRQVIASFSCCVLFWAWRCASLSLRSALLLSCVRFILHTRRHTLPFSLRSFARVVRPVFVLRLGGALNIPPASARPVRARRRAAQARREPASEAITAGRRSPRPPVASNNRHQPSTPHSCRPTARRPRRSLTRLNTRPGARPWLRATPHSPLRNHSTHRFPLPNSFSIDISPPSVLLVYPLHTTRFRLFSPSLHARPPPHPPSNPVPAQARTH